MNCQDAMERLGEYWDLPEQDPVRGEMDGHIAECESCREEFVFWKESAALIRKVREPAPVNIASGSMAGKVMARIYETESWRKPVALHAYSLSWRVRRNVLACFAMCLAIFFVSFLYSLLPVAETAQVPDYDIQVVNVVAQGRAPDQAVMFMDTPVVSVGPTVLVMSGKAHTYANYYLAASIAGVVMTLLLMNWLSRLRA